MEIEQSQRLLKKYSEVVPRGVHSNFRTPVYFTKAQGSRLWGAEGDECYGMRRQEQHITPGDKVAKPEVLKGRGELRNYSWR